MTPQRKANELYSTCFVLFQQPKDIIELAEINRQIHDINIKVCTAMESIGHPLFWRKTKQIIQKQNHDTANNL